MTVVPMQERHLAALAEIEKVCFHAPWSADMLREELGKGLFLVAERDGVAVGYVGCQTVLDEGYITNIAVAESCRRKGLGRAMLGALIDHCRESGASFLTLEVRQSNAPAIALYKSMGFLPEGRRKNFYRQPTEDAILMTKRDLSL